MSGDRNANAGRNSSVYALHHKRKVLYPNAYVWFVLLAALDLMFTWIILHNDGHELNILADWVIQRFDLYGVVAYKFLLVLGVVAICEVIGRRNHRVGLRLAHWAVILTTVPVVVGLVNLLAAGDAAPPIDPQ